MHLNKVTIEDLPLRGKRVIIRADFNVPLDESGHISDDTRIRGTLPTINYAVDEGAKVILCSHLDRPNGKVDPRLSLAPVARRLQRLLRSLAASSACSEKRSASRRTASARRPRCS